MGQEDNPQPVFSQKAVSRLKVYRLELYGNFVYEKVSFISAPIVGIVQDVKVQRGEQVNEGQVLMVVRRDEPGFTAKQTPIKAPFGGVVQAINAYEGVRFSPQTPLLTLAANRPLYLYADVLESDLAKIKVNDRVDIQIRYIDGAVPGRIVGLLEVDPGKRLARIRVEVANPKADIKAGSEGKIQYVYNQAKVVLVPAEAVFPEKGTYYVWGKPRETGNRGRCV